MARKTKLSVLSLPIRFGRFLSKAFRRRPPFPKPVPPKVPEEWLTAAEGEEIQSAHFKALRERMWLLEHPCAGNVDTTIGYGKWVGDDTNFLFVDYDKNNWAGWNPDDIYYPGSQIVKYRWGPGIDQVDIFVFRGTAKGDIVSANPPVVGGKLNGLWLLTVDPNKYSHWNFNAGRPDIGADARWIISVHGYEEPPGDGWLYGLWKAYQELPADTDPFEQIPYIKNAGVLNARHKPLELNRDHITKDLQTQRRRMFHDGSIPNHTDTWWWDHFFPNMVSEYIRLNGDPIESNQWGPDYREKKKNSAFQDRIQHLIEQNYNYVVKVSDFWKKNWQYWTHYGLNMSTDNDEGCVNPIYDYANGRGAWLPYEPPSCSMYVAGESVRHNTWLWMCIQDTPGLSIEPGVHPDWEDYWAKNVLYQPDFASNIPLYVQFSDYLFCCNSSAFEKVLKDIGHWDWYWDPTPTAAVPWWMYQRHYYWMTKHMADPDAGHEQRAWERWPLPRGCWRRVWRHTMNWDKTRNQKGRFGKEINIDGKMVAMMWPGEMGNPPGYDEQLTWWGYEDDFHYNFWWYRHVITQQQFDNLERPVGQEWTYTQHYIVVDVEEQFRQAYKNSIWPERHIAERHDPQATDWIEVYNERNGQMEPEEVPVFELHHELVNDMRDALLQLKYLRSQRTKEIKHLYHYTNKIGYSSGLLAYQAGKNLELYAEFEQAQFHVGYRGLVAYMNVVDWWHMPHDMSLPSNHCQIGLARITLVSANQDFPHHLVGNAMIRILYRTAYAGVGQMEGCKIGCGGIEIEDDRTPTGPGPLGWKAAYIGLRTRDFKWGWNAVDSMWEYKCETETVLLSDWPPESYYDKTYAHGEWRDWGRRLEMKFDVDNDCIFLLDFDGYGDDVFERDETNFIEVQL